MKNKYPNKNRRIGDLIFDAVFEKDGLNGRTKYEQDSFDGRGSTSGKVSNPLEFLDLPSTPKQSDRWRQGGDIDHERICS